MRIGWSKRVLALWPACRIRIPIRDAGGERIRRVQIVLAISIDVVPILLQIAEQAGFIAMEQVVKAAMPMHVNGPARHQAAAGRRANRVLNVALFEASTLAGEAVEIRRSDKRMPVAAQTLRSHGLRHIKDEVHFLFSRLLCCGLRSRRQPAQQ